MLTSLRADEYADEAFILNVLAQTEKLYSDMLLGELVTAFVTLSENGCRKIHHLEIISEAIYK